MDGCTGISQTPTPSEGCNHRCLGTKKKHGVVMLAPTHLMLWFDGLFPPKKKNLQAMKGFLSFGGICPANLEPRGYVLTFCWESWILWWIPTKPFFLQAIWFWQKKTLRIQTGIGWSSPIPSQHHYSSNCKNWFKNEKISGPATQHGYHPQITPKSCFLCSSRTPRTFWLFIRSTCNLIKSPQQNGSDGQKW